MYALQQSMLRATSDCHVILIHSLMPHLEPESAYSLVDAPQYVRTIAI